MSKQGLGIEYVDVEGLHGGRTHHDLHALHQQQRGAWATDVMVSGEGGSARQPVRVAVGRRCGRVEDVDVEGLHGGRIHDDLCASHQRRCGAWAIDGMLCGEGGGRQPVRDFEMRQGGGASESRFAGGKRKGRGGTARSTL
jgi:hypothetical protein